MSLLLADAAEYNWFLEVDVGATIERLAEVLKICSADLENIPTKQYNLFYSSQNQLDVIKINATLKEGYKITDADINIKLASKHPAQTMKTCILSKNPALLVATNQSNASTNDPVESPYWCLHQIQDSKNHLSDSIDHLTKNLNKKFETSEEVVQLINNVMNCLLKSKSSLMIPKKRTIEELRHSQNMQAIRPALPLDYPISFYIQASNLVCSVYHLSQGSSGPQIKAEYQAETQLDYLTEILMFLNLGLQICQEIKDKLNVFSHLSSKRFES